MTTARFARRMMPAVAIGALLLAGCGGSDDDKTTPTPAAERPSADLQPVKDYLLEHTTQLKTDVATLRQEAEGYYAMAKATNFDYAKLLETRRADVRKFVKGAQQGFADANPAYEQMEGVVAGVPSLADYDVIIDAGGDASDPENAVPFSIKTPDGRTFKQPGNFNYLIETSIFGTEPKFAAKGVKPDLDGDGKVEFGEAMPDANFYVAAARDFETQANELDAAARKWKPTPQDAFTALVVMTPTMSEYFEAWKNSRFVAGDKATEKAFVVASRLQDITDILGGLGPDLRERQAADRVGVERPGQPDRPVAAAAARLRREAARRGGGRAQVHGRRGRDARQRRAGPRRGDRRPDLAGGRQAQDPARELVAARPHTVVHGRGR